VADRAGAVALAGAHQRERLVPFRRRRGGWRVVGWHIVGWRIGGWRVVDWRVGWRLCRGIRWRGWRVVWRRCWLAREE